MRHYPDPDCILRQPFMVDYEGNLSQCTKNSDDREVVVRSTDITTIVSPSKDLLANYTNPLNEVYTSVENRKSSPRKR